MPYTVNGVEYDFNSCVNQRIKQDFVNREVMCCMTSEVEYILRLANELSSYDDPFTEEDVSNYFVKECDKCGSQYGFDEFYPDDEEIEIDKDEDGAYMCPVCGLDYDTEAEARECCSTEKLYKCQGCGQVYTEEEYEYLDENPQEVYEWWAVTNWLGDKLKERGEVVIEGWDHWYWGRSCTGQGIALDGVISSICYGMEILEGQKYSWENRT